MGKIREFIYRTVKKRAMHLPLLDPDPKKLVNLEWKIEKLKEFGADALLVGGSTGINRKLLDKLVLKIRKAGLPVILFPGNVSGVSKYANAILFMSLLNSKDPYWISGAQAGGALLVKKFGIEVIPMAYLIIEPGMKAGKVGKANLIKRNDIKKAVSYALAAQYLGMSLVYLEAGSGAGKHVPVKMVKEVKKAVDIPIIVGGGIRKPKQARELARYADLIVTGAITEENFSAIRDITKAVKSTRK